MTLGQLIGMLEAIPDKSRTMPKGIAEPHSWRGIYAELAFVPVENVTIQQMLDTARAAVGETYTGWKGGDYTMDSDTPIHISHKGESYDYFGEFVSFYLTGQKTTVACDECGERVVEPLAEHHSRVKCLEVQLKDAREAEERRKDLAL